MCTTVGIISIDGISGIIWLLKVCLKWSSLFCIFTPLKITDEWLYIYTTDWSLQGFWRMHELLTENKKSLYIKLYLMVYNRTFNTINDIILSENIGLTWVGGREACALEWLLDAIADGRRWRGQRQLEHEFSACLELVAPRRVARHSAGYGRDPSVRKKDRSQPCQAMCVFHNTTWHCWYSPQPSGLSALIFINTGCSVQVLGI